MRFCFLWNISARTLRKYVSDSHVKLPTTAMPSLLVIWRGTIASSHQRSSKSIFRLQGFRGYSRNVPSARTMPRKQASYITPRIRSGAFRPELVRFLNKDTPTILVQSSSPLVYKLGMYMLASFCLSYSVINYFSVIHDPPIRPSRFVRGTYGSICIAMAIFGGVCLYKVGFSKYIQAQHLSDRTLQTTRIISSLSAVPYLINPTTGQKGLMLRIETYRFLPLPGRSRKVTEIPADTVQTSDYLGILGYTTSSPFPPTRDEKIAERMWMREQQRKEHRGNMSRLLTLPFREAGQWVVRGFVGLRDLFAGDSFIHLKANDRNVTWKVSRDFDWALDNGHAFDKVVKVDSS